MGTTLKLDPHNPNKGTERGRQLLRRSIQKLGARRGIVVDKFGRIVAGNKTYEAAQAAGLDVQIVDANPQTLVAFRYSDFDLAEPGGKAQEYAVADNQTARIGLRWDAGVLQEFYDVAPDALKDYFFGDELGALGIDGARLDVADDLEKLGNPYVVESGEGEDDDEGEEESTPQGQPAGGEQQQGGGRYPLAIVLTTKEYRRWNDFKQEIGAFSDTKALLALLDFYKGEADD